MITQYVFSQPNGDISLTPAHIRRAFKISPDEEHPFLTLGDYFKAIEKFFNRNRTFILSNTQNTPLHQQTDTSDTQKLLIRSEKHGALYHIASLEISTCDNNYKFALNTALSKETQEWLSHEFNVITFLEDRMKLPYLPKAYCIDRIDCGAETFTMALMEWFEDYHEWHISADDKNPGNHKICLWDQKRGHRYLSKTAAFDIFRQASKILTLYYDTETFHTIRPWHHAAGDFIVQRNGGKIDVRLTTARKYQPFITFLDKQEVNPITALIFFFLDLTTRMRLDRLDGIGEPTWINDIALEAAIRGFFEALVNKEAGKNLHIILVKDVLQLLKNFNREEYQRFFLPLMDFYNAKSPGDYALIKKNLDGHINTLYLKIQELNI